MLRQINIKLIERIKKPSEGNKFLNGLLSFLTILIYPVIIIIGLVFVLCLLIISLFTNIFMSKKEKEKIDKNLKIEEQWSMWTGINGLTIFQKFKGEVRFGPAYLTLKSEPSIPELKNEIFGDWFFQYKNGLLLQKWNSTDKPDTDLIFIDSESLLSQTIEKKIPSVLWDIVETEDKILQLHCDTGREILTYKIEIKSGS
jgi:hypothetical protein